MARALNVVDDREHRMRKALCERAGIPIDVVLDRTFTAVRDLDGENILVTIQCVTSVPADEYAAMWAATETVNERIRTVVLEWAADPFDGIHEGVVDIDRLRAEIERARR